MGRRCRDFDLIQPEFRNKAIIEEIERMAPRRGIGDRRVMNRRTMSGALEEWKLRHEVT